MLRRACSIRWIERLLMLSLLTLLPAMSLPAFAVAAPDAALQHSLTSFFAHGVALRGATAELIQVVRWPETQGPVRWSLPLSLHGHPRRLSLIAEQGGKRWYVPVRVHWWATAIVMKRSVSARSLLTADMLKKTRTDIAGVNGRWIDNAAELIGMRLNRRMDKGDLLQSSFVRRPPLIKRGDLVQILLDIGSLHVRAEGKALRTVARGERILVRNLRSHEVIQAVAEDRGVVRIRMRGLPG
jgi:flagella basal body P-ring formation protein FlgA